MAVTFAKLHDAKEKDFIYINPEHILSVEGMPGGCRLRLVNGSVVMVTDLLEYALAELQKARQ